MNKTDENSLEISTVSCYHVVLVIIWLILLWKLNDVTPLHTTYMYEMKTWFKLYNYSLMSTLNVC